MSGATRIFLLLTAALCAAFIGLAGTGFAAMAEPARTDAWTYVFWALAALLVTAPLWIPALVSERHALFFKVCRWLSALALMLPILLFSRMFGEQVRMHGLGAWLSNPAIFLATIVLLACCLTSWVLLLRPELMRLATVTRRTARRP